MHWTSCGQQSRRREALLDEAQNLRVRLQDLGWNVGTSASQIVPLVIGDAPEATLLARQLRERGLLVPAIRPPSVPPGESLLRISLTLGHSQAMIDQLCQALAEFSPRWAGPGGRSIRMAAVLPVAAEWPRPIAAAKSPLQRPICDAERGTAKA